MGNCCVDAGGPGPDSGSSLDLFHQKYTLSAVVLGKGAFAEVRLASDKEGNEYAVKLIKRNEMSRHEKIALQKEIDILASLDHRNVVKLYDHFQDEQTSLIVMEYVPGGELFKQVEKKDRYTEKDSRRIVRTLAEALKYCSDRGVTHRDLKPENILLRDVDSEDIVLADFGFAFTMDPELKGFELLQTMCGTASYVAPEVINGRPYNYKCDIWSLGVIAFILLSGGYTLFGGQQADVLAKVKRGKWKFHPKKAWEKVSPEAKDLISHILVKNPMERYDYDQILAHSWFEQEDEEGEDVDLTELKKFNIQRKLYAAAKAKAVASRFQEIMAGSESILYQSTSNIASAPVPAPNPKNAFLTQADAVTQSGNAFKDLLDEVEEEEAAEEAEGDESAGEEVEA
mmetsp:Transcript_4340/g.5033  ORF Transcript_4340/g.5033 Transcript_4340/m.5033 type:complete len:399 (+) Transcript_4340:354-1550(+)